jgi:hypothetical protein
MIESQEYEGPSPFSLKRIAAPSRPLSRHIRHCSLHEIDGAIGTGQKLLYFRQTLRLGLADWVWIQLFF